METVAAPAKARGLALFLGWKRLRFTLAVSALFGFLIGMTFITATIIVVGRALVIGLLVMVAFGLFEQWPRRLPGWLGRWVLQLICVVITVPFATGFAYWLTTGGDPKLGQDEDLTNGYLTMTIVGLLFAPWIALGAMVRQREAFARDQAREFEAERGELERRALDARLRLLQAQVQPHFLFNTLANVQALVNAGSPQASTVLESLIAYLRAAVPRLHESVTTLDEELQLVRAYLEVMQMRMPDRLQFALVIDQGAKDLACPPMTLLTLVENAVRHGIDPSEEGGRIDVYVRVRDSRCHIRVNDTGVGLQAEGEGGRAAERSRSGHGLGTGLSALRERMSLAFGADTQLRLLEVQPHGVCAELDFPAQRAPFVASGAAAAVG